MERPRGALSSTSDQVLRILVRQLKIKKRLFIALILRLQIKLKYANSYQVLGYSFVPLYPLYDRCVDVFPELNTFNLLCYYISVQHKTTLFYFRQLHFNRSHGNTQMNNTPIFRVW